MGFLYIYIKITVSFGTSQPWIGQFLPANVMWLESPHACVRDDGFLLKCV